MNLPEFVLKAINMQYARRFTALLACECCGIKSDNLEEVKEFIKQRIEIGNNQVRSMFNDPKILSHSNFKDAENAWLKLVPNEVIKFRYGHLIK